MKLLEIEVAQIDKIFKIYLNNINFILYKGIDDLFMFLRQKSMIDYNLFKYLLEKTCQKDF